LLRSILSRITNSNLTDTQWLKASLAVKDGLGVRRVGSLAFPAFLASAAGTVFLQDAILAQYACPTDSFFETFLQTWSLTFGTSPPPMSCTSSLSGTGWAFSAIKLQWCHGRRPRQAQTCLFYRLACRRRWPT